MRLPPIERPRSWLARLAYWHSRRVFGRVLTPLKVLYARKPRLLRPYAALLGSEEKLRLPASLRLLVKAQVATINGCDFCTDMARHRAVDASVRQKLSALDAPDASPHLDARERAALTFAAEATRQRSVSDATFEALHAHFTDGEIVELTWLIALENFLNLTTVPLGIGADGLCAVST